MNSQITDQNGVVSVENLSNILFAERFPGGVPDAINACPKDGCIIYAVSPNVNLNLGSIDPGSKAITIYLGPYTYTVKQVTLRKALKIIGMGASGGIQRKLNLQHCSPLQRNHPAVHQREQSRFCFAADEQFTANKPVAFRFPAVRVCGEYK